MDGGRSKCPDPLGLPRHPPHLGHGARSVSSSPRFPSILPSSIVLGIVWIASAAVTGRQLAAQSQTLSESDSAALVEEARERQRAFEAYRASRIPLTQPPEGRCDEQIGRMCIWFGGEDEVNFPAEPPETGLARSELIGILSTASEQIADSWITGQLVRYLVEDRNYRQAENVARECALVQAWWCSALLGYVLHLRGEVVEAESTFRSAITAMPDQERELWSTPGYVLTRDGRGDFEEGDPAERTRQSELFWRFSDPLFLVEGNDRFTEHFARLVEVRNHEDAGGPQALEWEDDLAETLIRYGRTVGWSRSRGGRARSFSGPGLLQDDRRVIAHHHPRSRGYIFPEEFIEAPADIPPESWITAPREARTWYAPPYAPDFTALETQVGRFRRGDDMLVVGAYRPNLALDPRFAAAPRERREGPSGPLDPFARDRPPPDRPVSPAVAEAGPPIEGPVWAGFFLLPEGGREAIETRSADAEGVFTLRAPPGRYVSSLEVLELGARRAWRARQGVSQGSLTPGLAAVSDLLILTEGAPFPASLEEALPHVRPGIRIADGERFTVVWEAYGLQIQEPIQVTLGFTQGRPGFLQRVGEFLGVLEPDDPVEVTFTDAGPDVVQTAFRAVALELPDLEPGEYTLHLRVDLAGREPAIASRPIIVMP